MNDERFIELNVVYNLNMIQNKKFTRFQFWYILIRCIELDIPVNFVLLLN